MSDLFSSEGENRGERNDGEEVESEYCWCTPVSFTGDEAQGYEDEKDVDPGWDILAMCCLLYSERIHTAQKSDLGDVPYSGRVLDEGVGIFGSRGFLVIKEEGAPRKVGVGLGGPAAAVGVSVAEERPAFGVHGGIAVSMTVDVTVEVSVSAPVGAVNVGIAVSVGDAVGMVALTLGYYATGCSTNLGAERSSDC